jgi:hypothetical protein
MEAFELEEAEHGRPSERDANCQDPKLPTQMEQDAYETAEEAAAAARKAAELEPDPATEEQKNYLKETRYWATESGVRAGYAETAAENAEMLTAAHGSWTTGSEGAWPVSHVTYHNVPWSGTMQVS